MSPLVEINPDLRRVSNALERIASSLEQIALAAYGLAPRPRDTPSLKDRVKEMFDDQTKDVGYATDTDTLRQELEQAVMPGTVRERDGDVVTEEIGNVLDPHR